MIFTRFSSALRSDHLNLFAFHFDLFLSPTNLKMIPAGINALLLAAPMDINATPITKTALKSVGLLYFLLKYMVNPKAAATTMPKAMKRTGLFIFPDF